MVGTQVRIERALSNMKTNHWITLALLLGGLELIAQPVRQSGTDVRVEFDYSASSRMTRGSARLGDFDASSVRVATMSDVAEFGGWNVGAGLDYQRLDLNLSGLGPLPETLHGVAGRLSVGGRLSRRWSVNIDAAPGLYSDLEDVSPDDFNLPASVRAAYFVHPGLQLLAGFRIDWRNEIPIVGGPGVRWMFAEGWTLNLFLPAPNVTWQATERLSLSVGGEFAGGSFRVNEGFGTANGDPRLNNSQVSYREVRASAGLSYRFNPTSELILGAGVGLDRRATFNEQRLQLVSGAAPFVRLQYRLRF